MMSPMEYALSLKASGVLVKGMTIQRVTVGKIVEVFRSKGACPQTKVMIEDAEGRRFAFYLPHVKILS